jgi:hypothetical protein
MSAKVVVGTGVYGGTWLKVFILYRFMANRRGSVSSSMA